MLKLDERPVKESTMINLFTAQFGNLSVEKANIINFDHGILGFEELKQYVVVAVEECLPFEWLVSVEDPAVAFPILNPSVFFSDYNPSLPEDELASLGIRKARDAEIFCIVTLGKTPEDVTLNLKGPIVVNMKSKKGKQLVLTEDYYGLKHPIITT